MICQYRDKHLYLNEVRLADIAAELGTPCFVYSLDEIKARWRAYDEAFGARDHLVCYAVKANDNLSILKALADLGSGFDIVSGGELERVLRAGGEPHKIVFSGVGKTQAEIDRAVALDVGCINLESAAELDRIIDACTRLNRRTRIAVRVNPDVDAKTHPYISTGLKENKFGVPLDQAVDLYRRAADAAAVEPHGIACHIGSQLTSMAPVVEAVGHVVAMAEALRADGIALDHIDVGGGLGIRYQDEAPPAIDKVVGELLAVVPETYAMHTEPGRSIIGPAGMLLTRVEYLKATEARTFAIVDAAMNDLLRPTLYDAWHAVQPCLEREQAPVHVDVVGPVCESGDWLARDRHLAIAPGDLLCIADVGAYGRVMASNYNARPRAPEALVTGAAWRQIRAREGPDALMADEIGFLDD